MASSPRKLTARRAVEVLNSKDAHSVSVLKICIESIKEEAVSTGLSPEVILDISKIITGSKLKISIRKYLLRYLVPSHNVPSKAVMKFLAALNNDEFPVPVKKKIIQWLTAVFDLMEESTNLKLLNRGLLFTLRNSALSSDTANLLSIMNHKSYVTPFTVRCLQSVIEKQGEQPQLLHLASVYQNLRPDLLAKKYPKGRAISMELTWTKNIHKLRSAFKQEIKHPLPLKMDVSEISSIRDIKNIKDLTSRLTMSQTDLHFILHCLKEYGRFLIALNCIDDGMHMKLIFWISQLLVLAISNPVDKFYDEFFKLLAGVSETFQENITVVERFLGVYLTIWDGWLYRSSILTMISHWSIVPFEELCSCVLEPLHAIFMKSSEEEQLEILKSLTHMLYNWSCRTVQERSSDGKFSIFDKPWYLDDDELTHTYMGLAIYLEKYCTLLVVMNPEVSPEMNHATLDFFFTSLAFVEKRLISTVLPSTPLIRIYFGSPHLCCLSRFCDFLTRCKKSVRSLKLFCDEDQVSDFIESLNTILYFVLNAFFEMKEELFFHPVPKDILGSIEPVEMSLSLSRHPALQTVVFDFLADEDVEPDDIICDKEVRTRFLTRLRKASPSLADFIEENVKD